MDIVRRLFILSLMSYGDAASLREQLEHVARRKLESQNYGIISRRFLDSMAPDGAILGVPSLPSHLPEAEPILPGHTLLRPSMGMLKSAVKFPHKDLENGAGVYGNVDLLGLRYGGLNERILYTGFRRMPSDYILVLQQMSKNQKKPVLFLGAPLSGRPNNFHPDPQDENEIDENRLELQRAMQEFFQKKRREIPRRTQNKKTTNKKILRMMQENSDIDDIQETIEEPSTGYNSSVEQEDKATWFAKTKNLYTHVNINSNAPEHLEFFPITEYDVEQIRNWWYYNQDDFEPFDDKELAEAFNIQRKEKIRRS